MSLFGELFRAGNEILDSGDTGSSYYGKKAKKQKRRRLRQKPTPASSMLPKPVKAADIETIGGGILIQHDPVNRTVTATEGVAHITKTGVVEIDIEQHTFPEGEQPDAVKKAEDILRGQESVIKQHAVITEAAIVRQAQIEEGQRVPVITMVASAAHKSMSHEHHHEHHDESDSPHEHKHHHHQHGHGHDYSHKHHYSGEQIGTGLNIAGIGAGANIYSGAHKESLKGGVEQEADFFYEGIEASEKDGVKKYKSAKFGVHERGTYIVDNKKAQSRALSQAKKDLRTIKQTRQSRYNYIISYINYERTKRTHKVLEKLQEDISNGFLKKETAQIAFDTMKYCDELYRQFSYFYYQMVENYKRSHDFEFKNHSNEMNLKRIKDHMIIMARFCYHRAKFNIEMKKVKHQTDSYYVMDFRIERLSVYTIVFNSLDERGTNSNAKTKEWVDAIRVRMDDWKKVLDKPIKSDADLLFLENERIEIDATVSEVEAKKIASLKKDNLWDFAD